MAFFRNLCACPAECGAYSSGVNLRDCYSLGSPGIEKEKILSVLCAAVSYKCETQPLAL